jgi:hypothetical protein
MCSEGPQLVSLVRNLFAHPDTPGLQSSHKVTRAKPCDLNTCFRSASVTHCAPCPLRPHRKLPRASAYLPQTYTPSYTMWYARATCPCRCRVSVRCPAPPLTVPARGAYYARPRHAPVVSQGCKMFPVLLPMRRACAVRRCFPDPAHLWTAIGPSGCSPGAAPTPAARPPCADPTSSACPLLCRFFGIYPKCCTCNCCPPLLRQSCAACPALAVPCVTTRPFHLSPDRRDLHAVACHFHTFHAY